VIESGIGAGAAAKSAAGGGNITAFVMFGLSAIGVVFIMLAVAVVLMMRMPRSRKEWGVGLTTTVVGSLAGGAAVVMRFGLLDWVRSPDLAEVYVGIIAIGGVLFTCGLPAWFIVRLIFNFVDKNEGKGIDEVARDLKKLKDEVQQ
jgi:hypothetical protein